MASSPMTRDDGNAECPNAGSHTKMPEGYVEWHEWAEKKAKTHRARICGECKRYAIWEPKS